MRFVMHHTGGRRGSGEAQGEPESAAAPTSSELRFLEPKFIRFRRDGTVLRMTIEDECSYLKVSIIRAFPMKDPDHYWCILDGQNNEIGIIRNPKELDEENLTLLVEELRRRYVVATISHIISVREKFGVVEWEVETDRGKKKLITRNLQDNLVRPQAHQVRFTDVDGNIYDIPNLLQLDPASRSLLEQYL